MIKRDGYEGRQVEPVIRTSIALCIFLLWTTEVSALADFSGNPSLIEITCHDAEYYGVVYGLKLKCVVYFESQIANFISFEISNCFIASFVNLSILSRNSASFHRL